MDIKILNIKNIHYAINIYQYIKLDINQYIID